METVIPLPTMAFITPWENLSMSGVREDGNILPSEVVSVLINSYKGP